MFAVMLPSLRKTGFRLYVGINLRDPDLRAMLKLALPTFFYVITNLVGVSMRNAAAGATGVGGQAVVQYANIWSNLPYGILAVSVATAIFTELSHAATADDFCAFKRSLTAGLRSTVLLMLPASALLFGLARPLITLYVGGRMTAAAAEPIIAVLQAWAVTLVFFAGMMFVLRAFYSLKDTRTPAIANFFCSLLQVGGYLLLTGSVLRAPLFGIVGIPIADGIFFVALFVVLLFLLRKKIGSFDLRQFFVAFAKMGSASIAVGALTLWLVSVLTPYVGSGRMGAIAITVAVGCLGLVVTFVAAQLLGIEEITGLLKRKKSHV
jgi:putative peptidoglycan lipid II flippase